jgi:putative FmdB family regulatory protein
MPTYDYQCGTCDHRFEKYQGFHDEPLKTCPECGNEVRKVFSAAGIIFKGSGWYINDSRKVNGSKSEAKSKTEAKSEVKTEAKAEAKSEAKAEAKSEAKAESSSAKKNEAAA